MDGAALLMPHAPPAQIPRLTLGMTGPSNERPAPRVYPSMRIFTLLTTLILAVSASAQIVVPVKPFRSIELRNGGHVFIRHGSTQRVTILKGERRYSAIRVDADQRLVIDNHCDDCPRKFRLEIEVTTPELSAVAVSNGGLLQVVDAFPAQAAIDADVEQGGILDARLLPADAVEASVYSGGRISVTARQTLSAKVESGGNITYWGSPRVRESIRDGGVVEQGTPAGRR